MFWFLPKSIPVLDLNGQGTILFTSLAAYKFLYPSCLEKVKAIGDNAKCHSSLLLGTGATVLCAAICIRRITVQFRAFSRWKLAFTFGARLAGVRFVERYIEDPDDATNALRILHSMVQTDKHIHRLVVELGGIETTVKAMKKYDEDSEGVAASGVALIQTICGYSDSTDQKLMQCGGIRVLVQAMKRWPDNEELQANACKALDLLAANKNIAIQKKIIDVGGLVVLAEARTKHQNDIRVNDPATHAIILLVTEEKKAPNITCGDPIIIWQSCI